MKYSNKFILCSLLLISAAANSAPYVIGQTGVSSVTLSFSTPTSYASSDQTGVLGRIGAGYLWDFNETRWKYGLESGIRHSFTVHKDFHQANMAYRQYQIDALGVLDYHLLKKLDLFFKMGAAYARHSGSITHQQGSNSGHLDNFFVKSVVGIGFDITKNININLSAENNFEFDQNNRNMLAGLQYHFG